jgi:endonuclease/exonuclease/phosphatase family metal-dependent hydrolase
LSFVSRTPCPCTSAPTHCRRFERLLPGRFLPWALLGILLTAPLSAATLRLASFNVERGFGAPGTASFDQAAAVIARVSPDIIALVEPQGGSDAVNFTNMAQTLGYPYAVLSGSSALDTTLRTGFFSRYPVVSTNWVQSPTGAVEMTRQNLAVKIDVPGTPKDPLLVVIHPKCCSDSSADSFRRAIELRRTREFVLANTIPALDNVFVVGDYNLVGADNVVFNALPTTGLPASYRLGSDVTFPVTYRTNPAFYFAGTGLEPVPMAQVNGATKTYTTRGSSSSVLDYIVASAPVRARGYQTEIYNSAIDVSGSGLAKSGPVPATNASSLASDHFLLFGDFDLGGPEPAPVISWPVASALAAGRPLAESVLSGGAGGIPGLFAFAAPATVPPAGTADFAVVFAPSNTTDYLAVTNLVSVTVIPGSGGASFAQWSGGSLPTPDLLRGYAFGGASSPAAMGGIASVATLKTNVFSITAIVRTNDPKLTVVGRATDDLSLGPWSTNGVTKTNAVDQSGVPSGNQRQIFSIDRGTNTRLNLRLDAILQP